MKKPKKSPKIIRRIKYFLLFFKIIPFTTNWPAVPLAAMGFVDFSRGYVLKLKNGIALKAKHFMDAWTIKEIFSDNDYRFKPNKNKMLVIDIGANFGAFSVYAAHFNKDIRVLSYEPSKTTFKQLQENIKLNQLEDRIIPFRLAVGGKKRSVRLYKTKMSGLSSIYCTRGETEYEIVKVTTLSEILKENKIGKCDFLKIDCEGAEYEILAGCPKNIYEKIDCISLEFHEMIPDQDPHQLIAVLKKAGFKVRYEYNSIENNIGYIYAYR